MKKLKLNIVKAYTPHAPVVFSSFKQEKNSHLGRPKIAADKKRDSKVMRIPNALVDTVETLIAEYHDKKK